MRSESQVASTWSGSPAPQVSDGAGAVLSDEAPPREERHDANSTHTCTAPSAQPEAEIAPHLVLPVWSTWGSYSL